MKTPLDNEEQMPTEEWAKLRQYVTSPKGSGDMTDSFEQNVVTKILLTSSTVTAPDNFEDEVMRRISAESNPLPPQSLEKIVSALKTRTAAVIGVVALVTLSSISIYTVSHQLGETYKAPLLQNNNAEEMDLSPVRVELDTRYDSFKKTGKSKGNSINQDSSKLPIPGNPTQKSHDTEPDF
ncbi:MAG: hypothetical protein IPM69_08070 [Ignavibacteria bacterium]|nr:hypothetical protein [Ignavibacteria bacterium]